MILYSLTTETHALLIDTFRIIIKKNKKNAINAILSIKSLSNISFLKNNKYLTTRGGGGGGGGDGFRLQILV